MGVEVEYTDEFADWWEELDESEQESVAAVVDLLEEHGPHLSFPHSSKIKGSKHGNMRELRIQRCGDPYRVLYAFNPLRNAILLIGGNKKGDDDWYADNIPVADRLYDEHLTELESEKNKSAFK